MPRRRFADEKGRMATIDLCSQIDKFGDFSEQLRLVAAEHHALFEPWLHELDKVSCEPTEESLGQWAGSERSNAELMARDVWDILAIKLGESQRRLYCTPCGRPALFS